MGTSEEGETGQQRVEEPVATERLVTLQEVAEQLGVDVEQLRESAGRGELPAQLRLGQLLVEEVRPPEVQPERLIAGTRRHRARMAQRVALDHFFERLLEPVVPERSI